MKINYITCHSSNRPYDGLTFMDLRGKGDNHNGDMNFLYGHFDNFPLQEVYSEQWLDLLPDENLKLVLCWQQTPIFTELNIIPPNIIQHINENPRVYLLCVDALESIIYPDVYTEQCKLHNINPEKVIVLTSNVEIDSQKIDDINYMNIEYWESLTRQHHRWMSNVEIPSLSQRIDHIKTASKKFVSLNRNLKTHRVMWKYAMSISGVQDHGHVSYLLPEQKTEYDQLLDSSLFKEYFNQKQVPQDLLDHLQLKKLDTIEHPHPISYSNELAPYMHDSLVSFITESHHDSVFLTEKTFKAIAQRHPFFIIGTPEMHRRLRKKGYYTFEKLFGVEQVTNAQEAIELCKKWQARDIEDIRQEILADWMPKIEHNYSLFFNSKCNWTHLMNNLKKQINL